MNFLSACMQGALKTLTKFLGRVRFPVQALGAAVTLSWNAVAPTNNAGTNPTGYHLHQGLQTGNYTSQTDEGTNLTTTFNVAAGTYFWAVSAYNAAGTDGPVSNEVSLIVAASPTPTPPPTPTPSPTATSTPTPTVTPTSTPTPIPTPTPTATPTPSPTATPTATPVPTPGMIKIGNTTILPVADSGNANLLIASETSLAQAATIQSLSFYVTTAAGQLYLGLYSGTSAKPQQLLASTSVFTPVAGWNTQPITSPLLLQPGIYWLAYLPNSNTLGFVNKSVGVGSVFVAYPFGIMPPAFPTSGVVTTPSQWSFYATLNSGVAPTPTPTPTATPSPSGTPPSFSKWVKTLNTELGTNPTVTQLNAWLQAHPATAN